jgi:peroxiredoxin
MSDPERPRLTRLDPDAAAPPPPPPSPGPPPVVDTRRYRRAIGIIGLALVIGVSIYQFVTHGTSSTGVAPGQRLRWFAAPLADTNLTGVANLRPPCTAAGHDPRALNLCLDAHHSPVVLSLFVPDDGACVRQVDAMQALAQRYPSVRFVAVAVHAGRAQTARLVSSHHWTIPVADDPDGAVAEQYGVVICPMAELAARGGIVRDRLIGDRWQTEGALAPRVAALARASR